MNTKTAWGISLLMLMALCTWGTLTLYNPAPAHDSPSGPPPPANPWPECTNYHLDHRLDYPWTEDDYPYEDCQGLGSEQQRQACCANFYNECMTEIIPPELAYCVPPLITNEEYDDLVEYANELCLQRYEKNCMDYEDLQWGSDQGDTPCAYSGLPNDPKIKLYKFRDCNNNTYWMDESSWRRASNGAQPGPWIVIDGYGAGCPPPWVECNNLAGLYDCQDTCPEPCPGEWTSALYAVLHYCQPMGPSVKFVTPMIDNNGKHQTTCVLQSTYTTMVTSECSIISAPGTVHESRADDWLCFQCLPATCCNSPF